MLNENLEFILYKETAYAGGSGGSTRGMAKITDSTPNLISLPLPKSGSTIKMPLNLYQRDQIGGTGVKGIQRFRVVKEVEQKKGELECYIQHRRLFDWALPTLGLSESDHSFVIHLQTPSYRIESYGCVIEELSLNIPEKELPTHKIVFGCYGFKYAVGASTDVDSLTVCSINESQPLLRSNCSLSIGGNSILFSDLSLTIKNEIEPIVSSGGIEQIVKSRELTISFTLPIEDWMYNSALLGTTITKRAVSLVLGSICTFFITNCEVVVEELDESGAMNADLIKRTVKIYPTDNSVISVV